MSSLNLLVFSLLPILVFGLVLAVAEIRRGLSVPPPPPPPLPAKPSQAVDQSKGAI